MKSMDITIEIETLASVLCSKGFEEVSETAAW
jgi:hypothetical protein